MTRHNIGEYVLYRDNGIYIIKEIVEKDYGKGAQSYYRMMSVYDANTMYFVPTETGSGDDGIKHILSTDEINGIIDRSEDLSCEWIDDSKRRLERFGEILKGGDRAEILGLLKTLSTRKAETERDKRKFYASDEKLLNGAERIIKDEFAFVLGLDRSEVIPYIVRRIQGEAC